MITRDSLKRIQKWTIIFSTLVYSISYSVAQEETFMGRIINAPEYSLVLAEVEPGHGTQLLLLGPPVYGKGGPGSRWSVDCKTGGEFAVSYGTMYTWQVHGFEEPTFTGYQTLLAACPVASLIGPTTP